MNKFLFALFMFMSTWTFSQTVYTFGPVGAYPNPGWVSASNTGPANRVLNYQTNAGFVSSNDFPAGNRYVNGQITTYTSPVINTTCSNASTVNVTIQIGVDLESRYDWGYFQYSLNGGTTWNNPVALSPQNNQSGVNLGAYAPLINWANNNSNRNGWTNTVNATFNYVITTSANSRFRFIFASDGTVNSYTVGFTTYDYYFDIYQFDITCNVQLPIELKEFNGYYNKETKENDLYWITESERNNDYFTVEWTDNPVDGTWVDLSHINGAGDSNEELIYNFSTKSYTEGINYYRLSQTDNDGKKEMFDIIAIDNSVKPKEIVKIVNYMGQETTLDSKGVVFILYSDGKIERKINI